MSDKCGCDFSECPGVSITEDGIATHGVMLCNNNSEFFDMKQGEQMHLECYVRHVIKKALKELNNGSLYKMLNQNT